jgi:hypothetical protein
VVKWKFEDDLPRHAGAPWVLVSVSSLLQPEEMTLARTALQSLAELPVRVVLTLSAGHTCQREENPCQAGAIHT